jgi:hypothetical protein
MKRFSLLLSAALLSFSFTGCHKLYEPEPAQGTPLHNYMSAVVDGVPWVAASVKASRTTQSITMTGMSADGKSITFYIEGINTGEYGVAPGSKHFATYTDDTLKVSYKSTTYGGDGYVTIKALDEGTKTLSGRFHFKAVSSGGDTVDVTDGVFSRITYSAAGGTGGTKEMSARIDNSNWNADQVIGVVASGKLTIAGFRNDNSAINLVIPPDITPGSYNLTSSGAYSAQYNKNQTDVLSSVTGAVTIIAHNPATKTIKGEFSFEAEGPGTPPITATVTNGTFETTYE